MKFFVLLFVVLNIGVSLTVGQYFSSGFYQGGFRAAGFSPFGFQQNPFIGGHGGGFNDHTHTHVHYHDDHYPGGGFGRGGLGIGGRDVVSGTVGFVLGSLLNRNNNGKKK